MSLIAAYIVIQAEVGKVTIMAPKLREVPGVSETPCAAGPYDAVARAPVRDIDEPTKRVNSPSGHLTA